MGITNYLWISAGHYLPGDALRTCNLCNTEDQGDEFHFVFVCLSLMEERLKYIKRHHRVKPNTFLMNELFNVHSIEQLLDLSRFIKVIMSKFM